MSEWGRRILPCEYEQKNGGRMIKKALAAVLICAISAPVVFAYPVEGFEWGESFYSIERQLERRGKEYKWTPEIDTLVYEDIIRGQNCEVALLFIPSDRFLAGIALKWRGTGLANEIKTELTREYGQPVAADQEERTIKYYVWANHEDKYEKIILQKKPDETVLGYYGGRYYSRYIRERKNMAKRKVVKKKSRRPSFY